MVSSEINVIQTEQLVHTHIHTHTLSREGSEEVQIVPVKEKYVQPPSLSWCNQTLVQVCHGYIRLLQ